MVDTEHMIGSPQYLALPTRPGILASFIILARFTLSPTAYLHRADKRVLRYPRVMFQFVINYRSVIVELHACLDAYFAGDVVGGRSMSGYLVNLGDSTYI